MALDNFRTQKIIWDRANKKIFETIEANSGDSNGRKLVVQVINQETTEVLSGTTLSLGWKSRNGAKGLDAFNVVDASEGIFEIYYTTEMLSNIGNIEASLILINSTGRIESSSFTISVRPSTVDDESVESENSFTALTEALVKVNDLEDNYAPRLNEVTTQLAQNVNDLKNVLYKQVYLTDYGLAGDGVQRSISQVFPEVTLSEVQALNPQATLHNSADWYIIQKLTKELADGYTIYIDGNFVNDLEVLVDRPRINFEGKDNKSADKWTSSSRDYWSIHCRATDKSGFLLKGTGLTRIAFKNLSIIGMKDAATGTKNKNGIEVASAISHLEVDNCYLGGHGRFGLAKTGGHFILSKFKDSGFSYNCEGGLYIQHLNEAQVNQIIVDNIDCTANGYDYIGGKFVAINEQTKLRGFGLSISGTGIQVQAGHYGSNNGAGLVINDGFANGINLAGSYFEANSLAQIYVTDGDQGGKQNINISGVFWNRDYVPILENIYFEDETKRDIFYPELGLSNLREDKTSKSNVKLRSATIEPNVLFSNSPPKKYYELTRTNNLLATFQMDKFKPIKVSFNYRWEGTPGGYIYSKLKIGKFALGKITRESEIGKVSQITSSRINGSDTIITLATPINVVANYTHLIISPDYKDIIEGYDFQLYDFVFHGAANTRNIPSNDFIINADNTITLNNVNTDFNNQTFRCMLINAPSNPTTDYFLTKQYGTNSKIEYFIHKDMKVLPRSMDGLLTTIEFYAHNIPIGSKLIVEDISIENVEVPEMLMSDIYVDINNSGVTIYDTSIHQTVVWDGTNWRKKEGWELVT